MDATTRLALEHMLRERWQELEHGIEHNIMLREKTDGMSQHEMVYRQMEVEHIVKLLQKIA